MKFCLQSLFLVDYFSYPPWLYCNQIKSPPLYYSYKNLIFLDYRIDYRDTTIVPVPKCKFVYLHACRKPGFLDAILTDWNQ